MATERPKLNRYEIRDRIIVIAWAVGETHQDALETWQKQGPYRDGKLTPEAEAVLHQLTPERKAAAKPRVKLDMGL